jgi:uncharacterized membrane protein
MKLFPKKILILIKPLFSEKWKFKLIILGILILSFILRIYKIGYYGLWLDEIYSLWYSKSDFFSITRKLFSGGPHPPFYFWFLHFWIKFFGDSLFVLRLPSLVFGIITIYLIYWIANTLFDKRAGLYSAFLGAIFLHHIFHSQEVRMYTLLPLLSFLSFFLFYRISKEDKRSLKFLYFTITLIMIYTHFYGLLVMFAQLCYGLIFLKEKKKKIIHFFLMCLILLLYTPILWNSVLPRISLGYKTWMSHTNLFSIRSIIIGYSGFLPFFFYFRSLQPSFFETLLFFGMSIVYLSIFISLFKLIRNNKNDREFFEKITLILFYFGSATILPFLISFVKPIFDWRYTITAFPAFCILTGLGWAKINSSLKKIMIFLIITTSAFSNYFIYSLFPRGENEKLANLVNRVMNKEDKLVLVNYEHYKRALNYFLPNKEMDSFPSAGFDNSISSLQENEKVIIIGDFFNQRDFESIRKHLNRLNFEMIISQPFDEIWRRRKVEVYRKKKEKEE